MKKTGYAALILIAALLTGCTRGELSSSSLSALESSEQTNQSHQTEQPVSDEPADDTAEAVSAESSAGEPSREAAWNEADYPELDISEVPAKGEGTVKMTLRPYALDDVCVWLLADDAYSDGGKILCTGMHIGLSVSGVEQDIIEAPESLASADGVFAFDPEQSSEQVGYTSMPYTLYGVNSFSDESTAGCAYYGISGSEGEERHYTLVYQGYTNGRCLLTPEKVYSLPPEQLSGEYTMSACPAVVSCDGALSQQEALDRLAAEYLDSMTGDSAERSFSVLEYRNISTLIFGASMEAPADEYGYAQAPWNSLETWEMSQNTWIVDISAQFRGEGSVDSIGQLDTDEWYDLPLGGFPPRCWLMYNDGESWYLWSRNAYRTTPGVLS